MHSVLHTALVDGVVTLIALAIAECLSIVVAGVAALLDPESRNLATIALFALTGLTGAFSVTSLCSAIGAAETFTERWMFAYAPSAPTFIALGLVQGALAALLGRVLYRHFKTDPPPDAPNN